ncbi:F-box protein At2g26160-like [Euphorbia lathyris]|uniref:F-box protein At2g26160-like n=1 Tax=Euphorbia lathyris TaxID=212925 RepID=UPI003313F788
MGELMHQWADLPKDLLQNIAERFNSLLDFLPLRAVCTSWRSSLTLPSFVEEIPRLTFKLLDPLEEEFVLFKTSIYRVELTNRTPNSSKGWLTQIRHTKTGKLQLSHPISGAQIRYSSIPFISSSEPRFVQLHESFNLESIKPDHYTDPDDPYHIPGVGFKAIVPSSATWATNFVAFIAMIEGLWFWDSRDEDWKFLYVDDNDNRCYYHDIIEFKGQVYAVDKLGTVFWINPVPLSSIQYSPMLINGNGNRKFLVESCGDLYVVDMYVGDDYLYKETDVDFKVYKLDEDENGGWLEVKCLGDHMFVVNRDFSFSISSSEFVGGKPNCIYFTDYVHGQGLLFCLEDGSVQKLKSFPEIFLSPKH